VNPMDATHIAGNYTSVLVKYLEYHYRCKIAICKLIDMNLNNWRVR
jgi:hypothetical protein